MRRNYSQWAMAGLSCCLLMVVGLVADASPGKPNPWASPGDHQPAGPETVRVWDAVVETDAIPYGGCRTGQNSPVDEPAMIPMIRMTPIIEINIELGDPQQIEQPPGDGDRTLASFFKVKHKVKVKEKSVCRC